MPKGNPNPKQTEAFLERQKPRYGDQPLGAAISVRFPADIDAKLKAMPDRVAFIRAVVEAALNSSEDTPT